MLKFRTMCHDASDQAGARSTQENDSRVTPVGLLLRRTSIDELPQLWNVVRGEMSLVGPRPCLFNQEELIEERAKRSVFDVRPGITGLAQINEIDMSTPERLAKTDAEMIRSLTVAKYLHYIVLTITGKGAGDRVRG